ncbi:uncharacterized protein A4U43_C07F18120 [Asparagus officinalis]|uniref:Uncharacterized protein n=1 Tax=Asparagus officinalis TaxID=4686 RepID=A0A5P1ED21_ASPOF|nr:uncharacterized protein A4U43_C07F18120 [Asparagus officinalis]
MQCKLHALGENASSVDFDIKRNDWRKIIVSAQGDVMLEICEAGRKLGPEFGRYDLYAGVDSYMFCMFLPGDYVKQVLMEEANKAHLLSSVNKNSHPFASIVRIQVCDFEHLITVYVVYLTVLMEEANKARLLSSVNKNPHPFASIVRIQVCDESLYVGIPISL